MAMEVRRGEDNPMPDINLTPPVDVMLVLLTLLIIVVPLQAHLGKMDIACRARRFDCGDC